MNPVTISQPPNWMGFERFDALDNSTIKFARMYADPTHVVPHIDPDREPLILLIAKMAKLLDEKEAGE